MVRSKQGAKVARPSESADIEEDQVDSTTTEDKADHKLPQKGENVDIILTCSALGQVLLYMYYILRL